MNAVYHYDLFPTRRWLGWMALIYCGNQIIQVLFAGQKQTVEDDVRQWITLQALGVQS